MQQLHRLILACLLEMSAVLAAPVTISNNVTRKTTQGNIVRAQDGNLVNAKVDGQFALVGMLYGDCIYTACKNESLGACGFGPGRIAVYTSPDLSQASWSEPIEIVPASARPVGIYFRPHLIWNQRTSLFVLWVRWLPMLGPTLSDDPTLYLVATSPSLSVPFTVVNRNVTMFYPNSADDNLFVDDDGTAYIAHTQRGNGMRIVVERLSADYTACLGATIPAARSALIGPNHTEAPALFKLKGTYYLLFSPACCYCEEGSATLAYSAASPLGPYAPAGPGLGNAPGGQQNFAFVHPDVEGGARVLWAANRWGSGAGGVFDFALQYWSLLEFDAAGAPQPLAWTDSFVLNVTSGAGA